MKPTVSPRRKRPCASSRAASVTPPVRTCTSASSIAAALSGAPRSASSATDRGEAGLHRARRRRRGRPSPTARRRARRPSARSASWAARRPARRARRGSRPAARRSTGSASGRRPARRRRGPRTAPRMPSPGDDGEHAAGAGSSPPGALGALVDLLVHVGDVEAGDRAGAVEQRRSRAPARRCGRGPSASAVADDEHASRRAPPARGSTAPASRSGAGDGEVRAVAVASRTRAAGA